MNTSPYVSFVTWGRNDGYTPDYLRRVGRATNCLASQLERAGVDSEIVIVEWNPVPGRPLLLESLSLPRLLRHVTVRGFIVGPQYHVGHAGADERGIHVGEAANAGIRRARGRFITAKASDTFFSPDVIARLAKGGLDPDTMYRVDRHDFRVDDPSICVISTEELQSLVFSLGTGLSKLEADALKLYLEGSSYEEMAEELGCDTKTIDNALQRVKRKVLQHQQARQVLL